MFYHFVPSLIFFYGYYYRHLSQLFDIALLLTARVNYSYITYSYKMVSTIFLSLSLFCLHFISIDPELLHNIVQLYACLFHYVNVLHFSPITVSRILFPHTMLQSISSIFSSYSPLR